jgi:hypothetical protein
MSKKEGQVKGQDLVLALKVFLIQDEGFTIRSLSKDLEISVSEVSNALSRLAFTGLIGPDKKRVNLASLYEFIVHGVPYVFPIKVGVIKRGIPTSFSQPSLSHLINSDDKYVWPTPNGKIKGSSLEPLYPTVPNFIENDPPLHRLLALVDMIRVGRVREKKLAAEILKNKILGSNK